MSEEALKKATDRANGIGSMQEPTTLDIYVTKTDMSNSGNHAVATCRIEGERDSLLRLYVLFPPSALKPIDVPQKDGSTVTVTPLVSGIRFSGCKICKAVVPDASAPEGTRAFVQVQPRTVETPAGNQVYLTCMLVDPGIVTRPVSTSERTLSALIAAATQAAA